MNPLLMFVSKLLVSSALLVLFYFALFRGKASFRASRIFLVAIPLLSLAVSLVSVEGGRGFCFASIFGEREVAVFDTHAAPVVVPPVATAEVAAPVLRETDSPGVVHAPADGRRKEGFPGVGVLYVLSVVLLAGFIGRQLVALGGVRRRARREETEGFAVYFSCEIVSSFSVLRNIYVSDSVTGDKLDIVIRHEKEHISNRHYIDLAVMEMLTVAMWFNPFVWIARRELRRVHEFEADRGTLDAGVNMRDYMLAILQEATGKIPMMANGLKSSMIKKRFLKMKTENKIRLRGLRAALTVPFATAVAMFFALDPAAGEVVDNETAFAASQEVSAPAPAPEAYAAPEPESLPAGEPALVKHEVQIPTVEVTADALFFPDLMPGRVGDHAGEIAGGGVPSMSDMPAPPLPGQERRDPGEPRDIKIMARDRKGRPIDSPGVVVGRNGTDQMAAFDKQGNRVLEGLTDDDSVVIVAGNSVYEFPVAGLDSLHVVFRNRNKIDGYLIRNQMSDVLNIGYGTVSRRTNTGSVGTVDMSDSDGYSDLKSYIRGRVAGVEFMGDDIIIRGPSSLMASNAALIVVDGTIMPGFGYVNSSIHPSEVANISVLKDASTTAIYGSRGANGVVLITTKSASNRVR